MRPSKPVPGKSVSFYLSEKMVEEVVDERMSQHVAVLAACLAHDIKSPLASIKMYSEYLERKHNDSDFRRRFRSVVGKEIGRINKSIHQLMTIACRDGDEKSPVCLNSLVSDAAREVKEELDERNITLYIKGPHLPERNFYAWHMHQALQNLLINSMEAIDRDGCITVATSISEDNTVSLSVKDTGKGITAEDVKNIFQPFFTNKPRGSGLGLWIVLCALKKHKARIGVKSSPEEGTEFIISFPPSS